MKVSSKKPYYHGSQVKIIQFDTAYLNKGEHAVLGCGFYFTNDVGDALTYTSGKGKEGFLGPDLEPTLHTVRLDVKNPLKLGQVGVLSIDQVISIMRKLPHDALVDGLNDMVDVHSYGIDSSLRQVAKNYAGNVDLTNKLFCLSNDMFDDHVDLLNRACFEVLGFDGIIKKNPGGAIHVCAWFPEQIQIVTHTPAHVARKALEDSPSPH